MKKVEFKITLQSPLLLSSNTGDPNMVETYHYIPARTLKGLFANEYIKRKALKEPYRDERFYKWFSMGGLRFTDAFVLDGDRLTIPIPFSIQEVKREKKIYNLLFIEQNFDKPTKRIEGYGRLEGSFVYTTSVSRSLNFHHARDREKGISKEGQIFNYESLDPGQSFGGYIIGQDEDIDEFLKIFHSGHYYLGRSKNNQYGKVYIEFNANFKPHPEPNNLNPGELSLTLLSDTIIYNDYGFPVLDTKKLEEILGCKIIKSFIKQTDIEGFISVWRLKSPSEVSFQAGSTFLINVPDHQTLKRLFELQEKGIGERTEEGFGRFILGIPEDIDDALHHRKDSDKKATFLKPRGPVPSVLRDIITETLKRHLLNHIKADAIKTVADVQNPPPPSLVGRLILMLRDSGSPQRFINNLEKLRKLARDKLEDCRVPDGKSLNKFISLYEFIKETDPLKSSKLKKQKEYTELTEYASDPLEDKDFKETLHREYLQTFLSILLKEAKKK